ncbi:MAG: SDR family oxidoreductase [Anaerolineae bacterium]|nr:SDR family oxidoreductase [Anaerolineae bacterium]
MKILVIGGTRFVGRHFVDAALARGHQVTLFNRGQSNADLYPNVENLRGDRDGDLSALEGGRWDAVVDTCGYLPRIVRQSAELLADKVSRYLFISTISVYEDVPEPGADEDAPLQTLADPTVEQITGETYGGLKVLCEQVVEKIYGERSLIVRPGMIVGPYDPTDRYPYWLLRAARDGEILVPGAPDRPVQMIDARDMGVWMVHLLEQDAGGIFNATGPERPLTWAAWMESCRAAAGTTPTYTWVSDEFLQVHETNGAELPFWVPAPHENIFAVSNQRAVNAGLTFCSALDTARDTLAWKGAGSELKVGMKPEREAELLAAWHQENP